MFRKFLSLSSLAVTMPVIISVVLIFVGIVFLVLIHVCLSERLSRREGRGSMIGSGANGNRRMSINDLEKLPCYDYVAKDNTSSPVDCAVCLENLITGDKCRLLPMCKHSFHAQCVDTWLLKTPICPICRSNADSHGENQVIGNNMVQFGENLEGGPSRNVDIELIGNPSSGSINSGQ